MPVRAWGQDLQKLVLFFHSMGLGNQTVCLAWQQVPLPNGESKLSVVKFWFVFSGQGLNL